MSRFSSTKERHDAVKQMILSAAYKCNILIFSSFLDEVALSFDTLLREAREDVAVSGGLSKEELETDNERK